MKTQIVKIGFLLIMLLLFGLGCNKDIQDGKYSEIDFQKFSDFGCPNNTPWHLNPSYKGEIYLLKSKQEFEKCVTIDCNPNIDFSNYNVLVGRKPFTTGASIYDEKVETNGSELVYTITILRDETTVPLGVKYYVIIKKPSKAINIRVEHIIIGNI